MHRGRTVVTEPCLSADDIAAHLGVTKDTVYTWIAEKAMPASKVGRLWKFQASEVDDWVRSGAAAEEHRVSEGQSNVSGHAYADAKKGQEE
jgi:excisionase family DNA binding protein